MADREPMPRDDRPSGEMLHPRAGHAVAGEDPRHADHDLLVIAAAADRDADRAAIAAADRQMRDCVACSALFADLGAISATLTELPSQLPVGRDFRLTSERAAALRRPGWRERLAGLTRSPALRPVATALTTLGVAGLVLTIALPGVFTGGATSLSAPAAPSSAEVGGPAAGGAPAPVGPGAVASGVKSGGSAVPADNAAGGDASTQQSPQAAASVGSASSSTEFFAAQATAGRNAATAVDHGGGAVAPDAPSAAAILSWLSLATLLVGVALLLAARVGGRARSG